MTAARLLGRSRDERAAWAAWAALAIAIAVWILVFGVLVYRRHDRFASFGFDMGIFDQAVWLAARGKSFITVRGLDVFGHHANVAFYLLAPFSWLGAGAHFLNLLQVCALAGTAVPLFLLGRHRGLAPWIALVPAAAFLLHPTTGLLAWELFHPESVALVFLAWAYLASVHRRWRPYAVLLIVALAWKEDVALAAFFLGLLIFVRGDRKAGAWTMALTLGWFLLVNRVLLGAVNGAGAFYDEFYGDLGGSPFDIAWTALVHPTRIIDKFWAADAKSYLWQLASPFGFVPLAAPLVVLMGVPQVTGNILSVNSFTRDISYHYTALPLAALALGSVEALARFRRDRVVVAILAAAVLASSVVGAVRWGVSPIGGRYDDGLWPAAGDPRRDLKETALGLIPGDAAVSATYQFVPHLSHREGIYQFPNPYKEAYWGIQGRGTHDPDVVDWLAVDRQIMGADDRSVFAEALSDWDFEIVFERDDIVVARRR
ncbi:MAG: DUF2079 domain-containing protein [Actinobacteria bacterium]|nr:DUF2079 domain-containing protein [Actinomycetota bacterium]